MSRRSKTIRASKKVKSKAREDARLWAAICAASWNGELMVCSHGGVAIEHPHAYGYEDAGGWMYVPIAALMGAERPDEHDYKSIVDRRVATVLNPGRSCGPTIIDLYDRGASYEALRDLRRSDAPELARDAWRRYPEARRLDSGWLDCDPDHNADSLLSFSEHLGVSKGAADAAWLLTEGHFGKAANILTSLP